MQDLKLNYILSHSQPLMDGMTHSVIPLDNVMDWLVKIGIIIVVVLVGLFVAKTLAKASEKIVRRIKIDQAFATLGWTEQLDKIGIDVKPSTVVAWLVKWFIIIAIFSGVVNYLGAQQLADFLNDILSYLPNVIIAVVILVVGSLVANSTQKAVSGLLENTHNVSNKKLLASVPRYAIMTITILTALNHLGIGGNMVEILFTGIVVALSLALGIAFGLGGKEHAARVMDQVFRK